MNLTAFILPTVSGNPQLPLANLEGVTMPVVEPDAYVHYRFVTGDSDGLTDLANGRTLALQSAAPTYNADHIVAGDYGNALQTDLIDRKEYTIVAVVKYYADVCVAGTREGGGGMLLLLGGATQEVWAFGAGLPNVLVNPGTTPADGDWIAVGMTVSHDTEERRSVAGFDLLETITEEGAYTLTDNPIALGNSHSPGIGYNDGPACHEFLVWDRAFSDFELTEAVKRAVVRATRAGLIS